MPSTALGSFFSLSEDFVANAVLATGAVDSASGAEHNEQVLARVPELTVAGPPEAMQPEPPSQRAATPSESGTTCTTCGIGGTTPAPTSKVCMPARCDRPDTIGLLHVPAGVQSEAFQSVAEQRAHFRTDWHRCNVRRRLNGRPALGEAEFERFISQQEGGGDDMSSISGSGSGSEDEERRGSHASAGPLQRSAEVVFSSGGCPARVCHPAPAQLCAPQPCGLGSHHAARSSCVPWHDAP